LIGVIYVVAAAAAILLIDRAPQGAEHLKQILTGNILTSGLSEIAIIVPLYFAVGLLHWVLRRHLIGPGILRDLVFYASFGVVVTSSVAIAGVLLVFSFLIVPAAIGVMFASSLPRQLAVGWITGTLTSAAGLAVSLAFDLPTGAAMVCVFGVALVVAGLLYPFLRDDRRSALRISLATVRWCAAVVLAGSAIQLALAPRADQPLLDVSEYAFPSLRTLYFSRSEAATWAEAREYAERYRVEAERLNDLEKRNRTEGEALDDFSIRRISSFLKSWSEMRKGEQFVMGEVRARARERIRFGASLALLALALVVAPVVWSGLRMRSRSSWPPA
jgi:zinc/manganese transport system permease protein